MSENLRHNLSHMSTAELERLVRQDLYAGQSALGEDDLLAVLDELTARGAGEGLTPADESWEKFCREVLPSEEMPSLPEVPAGPLPRRDRDETRRARRFRFGALARTRAAGVALVLTALLAVGSFAAQAAGFRGPAAGWTESFGVSSLERGDMGQDYVYLARSPHPGLAEFEQLLAGEGVSKEVLPTWIPEEFALKEIVSSAFFTEREYVATFTCGERGLEILVEPVYQELSAERFKHGEGVVTYEQGGGEHYLALIDGREYASWTIGAHTVIVSGDISREEMLRLIGSIYID